ncbi:MAG: phosphodiester glycosidase family protein, partial [Symploca sp. SIO1A3]|nr:phosphodiester glycosidase family protein [Symploca sp. SIO1A3]
MRKIFWLSLLVISLLLVLFFGFREKAAYSNSSAVKTLAADQLQYQSHQLDSAVVHTLLIPAASGLVVKTAAAEQLMPLENFVEEHQALAVINGGFFDPNNQKT